MSPPGAALGRSASGCFVSHSEIVSVTRFQATDIELPGQRMGYGLRECRTSSTEETAR